MSPSAETLELGEAPTAPSDNEVVRLWVETREPELFRMLVDRYRERVFRLALSILGPGREPEAEDVAQDVFLTVFRRLSGFRMESRFATWLYRITYNRAIDARRAPRFSRPHDSDDALDGLAAGPPASDPQAGAIAADERRLVAEAMEEIPDLYRSVLRLYYWMERDVAEIAELLGIADGTVKSYLHRARLALNARLRKRGVIHA